MSPGKYGDPRVEATGEALRFYTALRIDISKSLDKDSGGVYGIKVKTKISKSKVGCPFGEGEYYIEFGKGIVRNYEILSLAEEYKIVTRSGAFYSYGDSKIGQGFDKTLEFLNDNPELCADIESKLMDKLKED